MPDRLPKCLAELEPARTAADPPDWRALFAPASPKDVLARLVQDDPLGLRARIAIELRDACYLTDADRVELRALARVARAAPRYDGRPELGAWISALVRESIEEIVRDDSERDAAVDASGGLDELARPLGLEAASMQRACAAFNRAPLAERRAFFALVIEGRALEEACGASGESATEVARRARRALDLVLACVGQTSSARATAVAESKEESS